MRRCRDGQMAAGLMKSGNRFVDGQSGGKEGKSEEIWWIFGERREHGVREISRPWRWGLRGTEEQIVTVKQKCQSLSCSSFFNVRVCSNFLGFMLL